MMGKGFGVFEVKNFPGSYKNALSEEQSLNNFRRKCICVRVLRYCSVKFLRICSEQDVRQSAEKAVHIITLKVHRVRSGINGIKFFHHMRDLLANHNLCRLHVYGSFGAGETGRNRRLCKVFTTTTVPMLRFCFGNLPNTTLPLFQVLQSYEEGVQMPPILEGCIVHVGYGSIE